MKLKSITLATAMALAGSLALTPAAQASSLKITGWAFQGQGDMDFNLSGAVFEKNVPAGGYMASLNKGPSFVTYCVDLSQTFSFNKAYDVTQWSPVGDPLKWYTPETALNLSKLFATAGAVTNRVQSAAMQLAIWEIVTGDPAKPYSLSTTTNGIKAVSNGGTQSNRSYENTAITTANGWLKNMANATPQNDVYVLYSKCFQDQLLLVPGNGGFTPNVPEPESWAMMLAGLGMVGLFARRRA